MNTRRLVLFLLLAVSVITLAAIPQNNQNIGRVAQANVLLAGRNVNMVSDTSFISGDPYLQRQNEPSIAVSTRNELHLLAGSNDYRSIDWNADDYISGPELVTNGNGERDAWLGVYISIDGGQSWKSTFLPGWYIHDTTPDWGGPPSPLAAEQFEAAADPVVRAGPNGLFYYCGIAFHRLTNEGVVFVARFRDNNNSNDESCIEYLDTKIIDQLPAGSRLIDKPWVGVDIPRRPLAKIMVGGQNIYRYNVYVAYTVFSGLEGDGSNLTSEIKVARSKNCGNSWHAPVRAASESFSAAELDPNEATTEAILRKGIYQGASIGIGPNLGLVYVAYRRFKRGNQADAMYCVKSLSRGWGFRTPRKIRNIQPFDMPTKQYSPAPLGTMFRTNSYPTIALDRWGKIYVAWAQMQGNPKQARIVVSSSLGGNLWTAPKQVAPYNGNGHQFMPAMTYAERKLMIIWYDQRLDEALFGPGCSFEEYIIENCTLRHTIDVRAATASPKLRPNFGQSIQVSKYPWAYVLENGTGNYYQMKWHMPGLPIFWQGTAPFIGDYIDVASLNFVPRKRNYGWQLPWKFNTDKSSGTIFHAAWTDNRDVVISQVSGASALAEGDDTLDYNAPESPGCNPDITGTRNQNIYTARIYNGIVSAIPENFKQLDIQRAFVLYVKNTTDAGKYFRLTVSQPTNGNASFDQFDPNVNSQEMYVEPFSGNATSVFVESTDQYDACTVTVTEIDGPGGNATGEYSVEIPINPDETNPPNGGIYNNEIHSQDLINSDIQWWDYNEANPHIVNPHIVNQPNPHIVNNNQVTPHIVNTAPGGAGALANGEAHFIPDFYNPHIVNSELAATENDGSEMVDVAWTIQNTGEVAAAYDFDLFASEELPAEARAHLVIYRIYTTPTSIGCDLKEKENHEVLINQANPHIVNPHIVNIAPSSQSSGHIQATASELQQTTKFWLNAGDKAVALARFYAPQGSTQALRDFIGPGTQVGGGSLGHPIVEQDAVDTINGEVQLRIITRLLPTGTEGVDYEAIIEAEGGTGDYTWSLVQTPNGPPNWLSIDTDEAENGRLYNDDGYPVEGQYPIRVRVEDTAGAYGEKDFTLVILPPQAPQTVILLSPAEGAELDNGCDTADDPIDWEFSWEPFDGAVGYWLQVYNESEEITLIDDDAILDTTTTYPFSPESWFDGEDLTGWTWRVCALVDDVWTEWSERSFTIEPLNTDCAAVQLPDYYIVNFSYDIGTVQQREEIGYMIDDVTIGNQGGSDQQGNIVWVGFYLSTDATIDSGDTLLVGGREYISALGAGENTTFNVYSGAKIPYDIPLGDYYLGVLVDDDDSVDESIEDNNDDAYSGQITIEAGDPLYAIADQDGGSYLYTVSVTGDPAQTSDIGALGIRTYSMAVRPSDKKIFVWDNTPAASAFVRLKTVDTDTAQATPIPSGTPSSVTLEALAFDSSGNLYGSEVNVVEAQSRLYSIDTSTGVATEVGPFGTVVGNNNTVSGMDFADSILYGLTADGAQFVTIDTGTGIAASVADISSYNIGSPGALVAVHGRVMLGSSYGANSQIFEIDRQDGTITNVRNLDIGYLLVGLGFSLE